MVLQLVAGQGEPSISTRPRVSDRATPDFLGSRSGPAHPQACIATLLIKRPIQNRHYKGCLVGARFGPALEMRPYMCAMRTGKA